MGFNSTVMILNDHLGDLDKKTMETIVTICGSAHSSENMRERGCHLHGQEIEVMSVEHADVTTIIAVGGNHHSILGKVWGGRHHTSELRIKLLKNLVREMGYRLVKLPKKGK